MPWANHIAGLGAGLRREVRNLFGFDERPRGAEPLDHRVTITVTEQGDQQRSERVGTTRMRSDQRALIDVDFQGRLSGSPREVNVVFEADDPDDVGNLELTSDGDDTSQARFIPRPGKAGIATVSWSATAEGQEFRGSETFEVEGEGVVLAGQSVTLEDQQPAT